MTKLTIHARGPASADVAWERYADFAQWPLWSPQIVRVQTVARRIAPGVTGDVVGPLGVRVQFVVDAVDEAARRWNWSVRRWPITLHLAHGVLVDGSGSATWLTIDGTLPIAAGYVPLARWAVQRLVAR